MKKISSTQYASIRNIFRANSVSRNILKKYGKMVDDARASIEATETAVKNITDGHTSDEFFEEIIVEDPTKMTKAGTPGKKTVIVRKEVEGFELPEVRGKKAEENEPTAEAAVVESEEE